MNTPLAAELPDDPVELATVIDAAIEKFAGSLFTSSTEEDLVSTAEVMESAAVVSTARTRR